MNHGKLEVYYTVYSTPTMTGIEWGYSQQCFIWGCLQLADCDYPQFIVVFSGTMTTDQSGFRGTLCIFRQAHIGI